MKYKLPFNHVVIAELFISPDWYFCTIQKATPPEAMPEYVTYQCNSRGDCSWGHYGITNSQDALRDMYARSPVRLTSEMCQ